MNCERHISTERNRKQSQKDCEFEKPLHRKCERKNSMRKRKKPSQSLVNKCRGRKKQIESKVALKKEEKMVKTTNDQNL